MFNTTFTFKISSLPSDGELSENGTVINSGDLTKTLISNKVSYKSNSDTTLNKKLCDVRECFEKYNLISGLHTVMSEKNKIFQNLLPPLKLLDSNQKKELLTSLTNLEFEISDLKAA